jgi:preprotein translocase subunit SecF
MALGALAALFHDVIITAGVYALFRLEVTPETVIAILTILGFSLYDTVVIYDKIKENASRPVIKAQGYPALVNLSLNQTIMRSVNTSLVVLFPIVSLLLFGGETLRAFAFALLIGVVIGAYSSVFVAAPLMVVLKGRETRARERGSGRPAKPAAATSAGEVASPSAVRPSAGSTAGSAGVQARPRKKKSSAKRRRR